jgi:hypothetical protein
MKTHRKRLKSAMLSIWVFSKSEIFFNFFWLNGVKLDADSNGTGPECPRRHLHAQNVKKRGQGRKHKNYFFSKFFFSKLCKIQWRIQWNRPRLKKKSTSYSKPEKTNWDGQKVRSIFFGNFFFVIDAKFDADFKNTCFELKSRQLHGEKLKKWCGKRRFLKSGIFSKFFFSQWCKFWRWFQCKRF